MSAALDLQGELLTLAGDPGRCTGCGARVLWVTTARKRRLPVERDTVRASVDGPGRRVALFVDGDVRTLREDPDGNVVGNEPHWATCTHADEFRDRGRRREPTPASMHVEGGRLKTRRVGLGLDADAAAGVLGLGDGIEVLHVEEGSAAPSIGWPELERRLREYFGAQVRAALAEGRRWQDVRFHGWSMDEVRAVARLVLSARSS